MKTIEETLLEIVPIPTTTYQTKAMSEWILENINKYTPEDCSFVINLDKYGNIYYTQTKGTDKDVTKYPCMVCHIDTVHQINHDVKAYIENDIIFAMDTKSMTQFGTGGDDKVGIAITLEMIQNFKNFKAVFFLDEEHGCIGSSACNARYFDDVTFVLQCDRRGSKDFVNRIGSTKLYSNNFSKKIKKLLKKYNRKEVNGGITDVGQIAKMNTVMCANMSCGYYNPHSSTEIIKVKKVLQTSMLCYEILQLTKDKRYAYNNISERTYAFKYNYSPYRDFTFDRPKKKYETIMDENSRHDYELEEDVHNQGIKDSCLFCNADEVVYDPSTNAYWCYHCNEYISNENINHNYDENQSNIHDYNQDTLNFTD